MSIFERKLFILCFFVNISDFNFGYWGVNQKSPTKIGTYYGSIVSFNITLNTHKVTTDQVQYGIT